MIRTSHLAQDNGPVDSKPAGSRTGEKKRNAVSVGANSSNNKVNSNSNNSAAANAVEASVPGIDSRFAGRQTAGVFSSRRFDLIT